MKQAVRLLPLLLLTASLQGQSLDYRYQAVFIHNFCKHTHWPSDVQFQELTIAVLGNNKVAGQMETFFTGKTAYSKKIVVKHFASVDELVYTPVLFVPTSNKNNLSQILLKVGQKPTLIITEKEGWGGLGSLINFVVTEEGKYRFELNQQALKKHNLKVTSELVALSITPL